MQARAFRGARQRGRAGPKATATAAEAFLVDAVIVEPVRKVAARLDGDLGE